MGTGWQAINRLSKLLDTHSQCLTLLSSHMRTLGSPHSAKKGITPLWSHSTTIPGRSQKVTHKDPPWTVWVIIIMTAGGVRKETSVLTKYHPRQTGLIDRANNCLEGKQFAEMCVSEAFYNVMMDKRLESIRRKTTSKPWSFPTVGMSPENFFVVFNRDHLEQCHYVDEAIAFLMHVNHYCSM